MRFLTLLLAIITLGSCKTAHPERSKLDAGYWRRSNRVVIIHYDNNAKLFHINYCTKNEDRDREFYKLLTTAKDAREVINSCKDATRPVPAAAFQDQIKSQFMAEANNSLTSLKDSQVKYISEQLKAVKSAIKEYETIRIENMLPKNYIEDAATAQVDAQKDVETYTLELARLNSVNVDDRAQAKADLDFKVDALVSNQAKIWTDMLKDAGRFQALDPEKDKTLMAVIAHFEPTCTYGRTGDKITEIIGVEEVKSRCDYGISKDIERRCAVAGYEMLGSNDATKRCVFTGANLTLSRVAATSSGMCGVPTKGNQLVCWGSPGRIPMEDGPAVDTQQLESVANLSLAATLHKVCAFNPDKTVKQCWGLDSTPNSRGPYQMVTTGLHHFCGINSGVVSCWGALNSAPVINSGLGATKVSFIVTDKETNCALTQEKDVKCWGNSSSYSSLNPDFGNFKKRIVSVGLGDERVCVIDIDKKVKCWAKGKTFDPGVALQPSRFVFVNQYEACSISVDNTLNCWRGENFVNSESYVYAPSLTEVKSVYSDSSKRYFCATYGSGENLKCWGNTSLIAIEPISNVKSVAITEKGYFCAMTGDGVKCFGNINEATDVPAAMK